MTELTIKDQSLDEQLQQPIYQDFGNSDNQIEGKLEYVKCVWHKVIKNNPEAFNKDYINMKFTSPYTGCFGCPGIVSLIDQCELIKYHPSTKGPEINKEPEDNYQSKTEKILKQYNSFRIL